MSIEAMDWARKCATPFDLNDGQQNLLNALANYANEDWVAGVSRRRLAEDMNVKSHNTITKRAKALESLGLIKRGVQECQGWTQQIPAGKEVNLYKLNEDILWKTLGKRGHPTPTGGGDPTPVSGGDPTPTGVAVPSLRTVSKKEKVRPSEKPEADPVDKQVEALCKLLTKRANEHFASKHSSMKIKPSKTGYGDMERLLRLGSDHKTLSATPDDPAHVTRVINGVFDRLNTPDNRGFCWADQILSPGKLRTQWPLLIKDLNIDLETRKSNFVNNGPVRPSVPFANQIQEIKCPACSDTGLIEVDGGLTQCRHTEMKAS